jgi:hypothetical protein
MKKEIYYEVRTIYPPDEKGRSLSALENKYKTLPEAQKARKSGQGIVKVTREWLR